MTIGYVGLGAMGRALATRLAPGGDLLVWDLNPAAIDAMVVAGAQAAASFADLGARCDIVLLCLPTSAIVEQALFAPDGLASTLKPGSLVIDQTSGVPAATRAIAARLAERGVAVVDAPVAGGVPSALAGQITIMASGPADAVARAEPMLARISPKLFPCGDTVGDGQAVKAINNLINTGYRMATLELLGLARRLGMSAAALTERLNAGPAASFVTARLLPAVVEGRSSADFALGLMVKDVDQAAAMARAAGVAMPVSDAARALMRAAFEMLGDDSRLDDLVPFMARGAATDFTGPATGDDDVVPALVEATLAAVHHALARESLALADALGLDRARFAAVMAAGSGASVQANRVFAGASDTAPDAAAVAILGDRAAALDVLLTITTTAQSRG